MNYLIINQTQRTFQVTIPDFDEYSPEFVDRILDLAETYNKDKVYHVNDRDLGIVAIVRPWEPHTDLVKERIGG